MSTRIRSSSASSASEIVVAASAAASPSKRRRASVNSKAPMSSVGRGAQRRLVDDVDPRPRARLDQAAQVEGNHCLANGRPADFEFIRQVALRREALADFIVTRLNSRRRWNWPPVDRVFGSRPSMWSCRFAANWSGQILYFKDCPIPAGRVGVLSLRAVSRRDFRAPGESRQGVSLAAPQPILGCQRIIAAGSKERLELASASDGGRL